MPFQPNALANARTAYNGLLTDSATIVRTGKIVPCRVSRQKGLPLRFDAVPRYMPSYRWRMTFPDATDVQIGDTVNVAGKPSYKVLETTAPTTISISTTVFAIETTTTAGFTIPFVPTNTVVFHSGTQKTGPVPVAIRPLSMQERIVNEAPQLLYEVAFPANLLYPDGTTKVHEGDLIAWSGLRDSTGKGATLKQPVLHPGLLPYATATFGDL